MIEFWTVFAAVMPMYCLVALGVVLRKAEVHHQLLQVNRFLSEERPDEEGGMHGRSPSLLRLRQLIERVAPTDATVLTRVPRALHVAE